MSKESCTFLASYFQERKQCVKVGGHTSNWLSVHKGAPQGSIFGPFLFNVFQNDLLVKLADLSDIYNYADDNTVVASGDTIVSPFNCVSRGSIGLPGLSLWLSNSRKTSRYAPWSTYLRSYHTVYIIPF